MAEYIEFSLSKTSKTVPIFAMLYSNYISIDVPGLDESCVNDFTTDVEESAQSWLSTTGFSYVIPTFNNEVIEDAAPHIDAGFSVTENASEERTGIITVSHVGGWSATYTVTQKAGLTVDDIPADAYKEIVPGTTPWFSTRNQENFPDYNWDKAEKVLYMTGDCLQKPSASLYVPESWITEDTIVRCCIEADENSRNTISDWLYDFGEDNGWWTSTDYPGFKHYGYDVGSRYTFEMTTVTHRTVKLTFVLCNYNGEIGNYFAIPFRIVQCKNGITKAEFDELVKLYGPSNYDGTMNNLDRFGFDDDNDTESTDPSTPSTPSTTDTDFTGNLTFEKSEVNVPANAHTNVVILNAKGLKKTDVSKISIVSSVGWISNIIKTYKTNINGDAYLWITFKTDENTDDARTGNINVSINSKTAMLKINQVAAEDTTTDTTNNLTAIPRFDGENNISVKANSKTITATLNVWNMTEEECTNKITVRSNASWIKDLNIKYIKKDN